MAKWDVDYDDYEEKEGSGYDGEQPRNGIYPGRLVSLKEHESGNSDTSLEWVFEITEGDYEGWRGWSYSNLDGSKWKTQQYLKAINGGVEKKTSVDPSKHAAIVKKAKPVRLRIKGEKYEGERRARIGSVLPGEASSKKGKGSDDPWDEGGDD